jgi:hypothetical protein
MTKGEQKMGNKEKPKSEAQNKKSTRRMLMVCKLAGRGIHGFLNETRISRSSWRVGILMTKTF